jgi:hypothetical protein
MKLLSLYLSGALLLLVSCRDYSLHETLEIREREEQQESVRDSINSNSIRVVADRAAALATPNCIMARSGDTITIPVAKAFAVWEQNQELFGKKFLSGGDLGAILVWAMPYNLVNGEEIEITGYEDINKTAIKLRSTPGMHGNALVALAMDGEIRWSWHLWVTDYNPGDDLLPGDLAIGPNDVSGGKVYRYENNTGDNIFMDRNLGANSADKYSGKEAYGMYYQWGKKDPMPGFAPTHVFSEDKNISGYANNNLAYSIEYPDELLIGAVLYHRNWYSNNIETHDYDLWGAVSKKKTIYDPCPKGWKVPLMSGDEYNHDWDLHWTYRGESSPWYITDIEHVFVAVENEGRESPVFGYYPPSSYIIATGELYDLRLVGCWTGTPTPPVMKDELSYAAFMNPPMGQKITGYSRNYGFNIRCIRDLTKENR